MHDNICTAHMQTPIQNNECKTSSQSKCKTQMQKNDCKSTSQNRSQNVIAGHKCTTRLYNPQCKAGRCKTKDAYPELSHGEPPQTKVKKEFEHRRNHQIDQIRICSFALCSSFVFLFCSASKLSFSPPFL